RLVADTLCLLKDSFSIDGGTLTTPDEMFVQRDRLDVLARAIQNQVDGFRVSFADAMQEYPEVIKIPYTIIAEIGKLTIGV
ncbi:hypothetical protein CGJ18_24725, partial [Vibrio parahaemolyticus]